MLATLAVEEYFQHEGDQVTSRLSFRNHSKGGETIVFYHKGARKGLDLKNNTTATSIKGGPE